MNATDIHKAADEQSILWDDDPVFKIICKQLTGKTCLDKMSSHELELVYGEISLRPEAFSKNYTNESNDFLFKQN